MGTAGRPRRAVLAWIAVLALVAGCGDGGGLVVGSGSGGDGQALRGGLYSYRAWSDATSALAWSGWVELRIEPGGVLAGGYQLPGQCSDGGWVADCVGRVGGRVERDGRVRFGLDEGWLAHEGSVARDSRVSGRWESRILGWSDAGDFVLEPIAP